MFNRYGKFLGVFIGMVLVSGLSMTANAQDDTIGINPISVMLSSDNPVAVVRVTNRSNDPIILNSKLFNWERKAKQDVSITPYTGKELTMTPPVARLNSKAKQIIRVGLVGKMHLDKEALYRLYVTEVASQPKAANVGKDKRSVAVKMSIRLGIPVYVQPENPVRRLAWDVKRTGKTVKVKLSNLGNTHVKVLQLNLTKNDFKDPINTVDVAESIFAGESGEWTVNIPQGQDREKLKLRLIVDDSTPVSGKEFNL